MLVFFFLFLQFSYKSILVVILSVVTAVYFAGTTRPISRFRLPITTASIRFSVDSSRKWYIKLEILIGMCPTRLPSLWRIYHKLLPLHFTFSVQSHGVFIINYCFLMEAKMKISPVVKNTSHATLDLSYYKNSPNC